MREFVRSVCGLVDAGETCVLATVVESSGSTPRSSGAKMAVRRDGSIVGTVGGGLAEAMACREGLAIIGGGDGAARLLFVDMTRELAAESDMICGGGLSILLETVEPDGPGAAVYRELDGLLRQGVAATLSTRCEETDALRAVNHMVLKSLESTSPRFENRGMDLFLWEPFVPPAPLYIFGAGHVALFTARVASMVGFRTVVLDDRADFANRERFPTADEVVVLDSFDGCCDGLEIGRDASIVIVTRGHLHDRNVLAEALDTDAGYVGMIGSRKKRDKIYDSLLADGFAQADIDRCRCPIGLTIGAQTPEEIAVSIVGELIQARAERGA
jgi:xanthine dehydrogenase accessory factor